MMKNRVRLFSRFGLFISISILAMSCSASPSLPEASITPDTSNRQEATPEVSHQTTPVKTILAGTSEVSIVHTPTATNTALPPTAIVSPTSTPPPVPTLTKTEEGELVQEFMILQEGCQLPCWWNIQFGDNLESIGDSFAELGIESWEVTISDYGDGGNRGYVKVGYFNQASSFYEIGVSLDFFTVDEKVQYIDVSAERPLRQYGEAEIVRDWNQYALSSIIQKYGETPYVYLFHQVADPGPPNFDLILYYPDLGFKFSFQPHNTSNETEAELCLALNNMRQINLSLYNPEFVDVWANYLLPPALNPETVEYFEQWAWEAQTGIDLAIFYETYKDSTTPECIVIDR